MADFSEIDFLDVETKSSGDAICIRYEVNGKTYIHIVDGGYQSTGEKVIDHLTRHYGNPSYIDHVVATHNDGDHAVGLRAVLEHYTVGTLWMLCPWWYAAELLPRFARFRTTEGLAKSLREVYPNLAALEDIAIRRRIQVREPFQGELIGSFRVMSPSRARFMDLVVSSEKTSAESALGSLLAGVQEAVTHVARQAAALVRAAWGDEYFPAGDTSNENEMSVVQYATLCGRKIVLTGDTGRAGLREVIDFAPYVGLALPGIDRFQVPHHGGRHNVTTQLLDELLGRRLASRPADRSFTAVISSAKEDEDHPRKSVVRAMHHRGAQVVTTEGASIRTSQNVPNRGGWVAATPVPYPEEQED